VGKKRSGLDKGASHSGGSSKWTPSGGKIMVLEKGKGRGLLFGKLAPFEMGEERENLTFARKGEEGRTEFRKRRV